MSDFKIIHKGVEVEIPNSLIEALSRYVSAAASEATARYPSTKQTFARQMNARFQNEVMPEIETALRAAIDKALTQKEKK